MADCSEHAKVIMQLAMNLASRKGVNNLDDVVSEMKTHVPWITRRGLVEAIVEATSRQARDVDDLLVKLNTIKKEARDDYNLRKRIAELEEYLENGTLPKKKSRIKEVTKPIQELRKIRDDLNKQLRQSGPAKRERLIKSIKELEEKIKTGDIAPKVRPRELEQDEGLRFLEYQRDRLRRQIRAKIIDMRPKTFFEKLVDPLNAVRALKTSFDFSATLRQGGFIAFGHPVRAAKALKPMFKAFASERKSIEINNDILNRKNAPLYAKSKLYIAPIDMTEKLSKMEEAYMSKLAEKIPGIRASERAYVTFLNKLRADSFDAMIDSLSINGEATQDEMDAIANYINAATGRGRLGKMEAAAVGLNTAFFAPRYVASRFQLLTGQPLWKGTKNTRKMVAKEYARFLAGLGIVYMLGAMAGGEPEEDPRSADFGKIRFGDARLDPLLGISQNTVLLTRMIVGETKSSINKDIKKLRGKDVPYGGSKTGDVLWRFLRSKLSPTFGIPLDIVSGENVVGEKVSLKTLIGKEKGVTITELLSPLAIQDIYRAMRDQGVSKGAALGILSIFGIGLQVYGYRTQTRDEIAEAIAKNTYSKTGKPHKNKDNKVNELMKTYKEKGGSIAGIRRARKKIKEQRRKR